MPEQPPRTASRASEDDPAGVSERPLSIGRYLTSQRRLRGISLDELASRTKIPRRNLERLEAGAFDANPDGFVRGFVRTVAEALGLDPNEAVMRLLGEPSAADEEQVRRRRRRAIGVGAALAALLLVALVAGLRIATRWAAPDPSASGSSDWVYRRDAVRRLASEPPSASGARAAESERGGAAADDPLPNAAP